MLATLRIVGRQAILVGLAVLLCSCGGGGGGAGSTPPPPPITATIQVTDPSKASNLVLPTSATSALTIEFPAHSLGSAGTMTASYIWPSNVPALNGSPRRKSHTSVSGGTYVAAFQLSASEPANKRFTYPLRISGSGLVPSSFAQHQQLNIAMRVLDNGPAHWVDVGTFQVGQSGSFAPSLPSTVLNGVLSEGLYVIYVPGINNQTVGHYGFALMGSGNGQLNLLQFLDGSGSPINPPTSVVAQVPGKFVLNGMGLTADASTGIVVDNSQIVNTIYGMNRGSLNVVSSGIDVSSLATKSVSVALTPDGDTAILTDGADFAFTMSEVNKGHPALSDTIMLPGSRDGLVISADGKVLLARGLAGLTVLSISKWTGAPGPLGGSINYHFTTTKDFPGLGVAFNDNGRDGMAISPTDSTRAIVAGQDANGSADVTLLTGLPDNPIATRIPLRISRKRPFVMPRRWRHPSLQLNGATQPLSVAITQDGKSAIVGTDNGLVLLSGIDTGNVVQVGATTFNPDYSYIERNATQSTTQSLGQITSLGITLDNRYVIVISSYIDGSGLGTVLMLPFDNTMVGTPVSQYDNVQLPYDDQVIVH